jgi:hypothetical protein
MEMEQKTSQTTNAKINRRVTHDATTNDVYAIMFANVTTKYAKGQGYYCGNICFDVFVKMFLLGGMCGRDVWRKGDILYKQLVLEFKVDRVRYKESTPINDNNDDDDDDENNPSSGNSKPVTMMKNISADWLKSEIEKLEEVYEAEVQVSTGLVLVEVKARRVESIMVLRATISNLVDRNGAPLGAKFIQEHTEPRDCFCC